MRESIGGTWILQLVIVFMLLFVGFLALSLNYSKAFRVKNEMLNIIEKYEGLTNESIGILNNYLKNNGYSVTKSCEVGSYGASSLDSNTLSRVSNNDARYYYCVKKIKSRSDFKTVPKVYYQVNMFFYFNLPVVGEIFKFDVGGTTKTISYPADDSNIEAVEE